VRIALGLHIFSRFAFLVTNLKKTQQVFAKIFAIFEYFRKQFSQKFLNDFGENASTKFSFQSYFAAMTTPQCDLSFHDKPSDSVPDKPPH
jgi:hypothetical protein